MDVEVLPDPEAVARRAAGIVAAHARAAVAAYGRFLLAASGGSTPRRTFELLAGEDVPWPRVHLFQVDERVAPAGDPDRNLVGLEETLLARAPIPRAQVHPMPVEEVDLAAAAARYEETLRAVAGPRLALDLVQLGLGADGHTASLFPGDATLDTGADVAVAGPHQGRRRMTLTLPALERAQRILWIVTGAAKAEALGRLRRGDRSIPAARVPGDRALLLADAAAAGARG
jgi:6-phosphogluconolactonase